MLILRVFFPAHSSELRESLFMVKLDHYVLNFEFRYKLDYYVT